MTKLAYLMYHFDPSLIIACFMKSCLLITESERKRDDAAEDWVWREADTGIISTESRDGGTDISATGGQTVSHQHHRDWDTGSTKGTESQGTRCLGLQKLYCLCYMKGLSLLIRIIRQPTSDHILFSQSYKLFEVPVRKFTFCHWTFSTTPFINQIQVTQKTKVTCAFNQRTDPLWCHHVWSFMPL